MTLKFPSIWVIGLFFILTACAPTRYPPGYHGTKQGVKNVAAHTPMLGEGGYVKRGSPYKIDGKMYYPLASGDLYDETGVGSWYGEDFHGKKTANGERYDMYAMTAAHTVLPMPSLVRVTNLDNGKSIQVRVNDRGPFVKNRLIDLSYAAAKALGYAKQGTARVRVQALSSSGGGVPLEPTLPIPTTTFPPIVNPEPAVVPQLQTKAVQPVLAMAYVQVGAFGEKQNADNLITVLAPRLKANHPPLKVVSSADVFRVRLGPFDLDEDAMLALEYVRNQGYAGAMVIYD